MATPAVPTNCFAVTAALTQETGRYSQEIYSKSAWRSPIVRLQTSTRGDWMNGMGDVINILTYQRSFPNASIAALRTNIAPSNGDATNACTPPKAMIGFGQQTRNTQLRHVALETPYFCIRDITNRFEFARQLAKHVDVLADVSGWVWRDIYTTDYVNTAEHHITINQAAGGVVDNGTTYSVAQPGNARLQQVHLEEIAVRLMQEGGDSAPSIDVDTQEPIWELIIGKESSDYIFRNDPKLADSIRWATAGLGLTGPDASYTLPNGFPTRRRQFGGFIHNINPYPRRFEINAGAYVETPVWLPGAKTIGVGSEINPDWRTATYEETIIWHPRVYRSLVPRTIIEPSPGWKFNPVDYQGHFRAVNILDRTCNVDGTNIFWRAIFSDAAEPIKPELGYAIIHSRCGYPSRAVGCYYTDPID
jgi:hypothetical protein